VCAYGKTAVTLGHWYLHPTRICFFSGVPRTFIEIPLVSVQSIQKTNTAFIFRTAIEIQCAQGTLFFGSFTSRHAAFMHVVDLLHSMHGDSLHVISDSNSSPTVAFVRHSHHYINVINLNFFQVPRADTNSAASPPLSPVSSPRQSGPSSSSSFALEGVCFWNDISLTV
jgi:hypothetical protein